MKNKVGIIFFLIHFILEVTTFYILSSYSSNSMFWIIALLFDLFAFVPQGIIGGINDKYRNINFGIIGVILTILSIISYSISLPIVIVVSLLTIGNCLIHVNGAEQTIRVSKGKMFGVSLFVSGGSFGIIIGRILNQFSVSSTYIIILNILSLLLTIYALKCKKYEEDNLKDFNYSNKNVNIITVIVLCVFVVAVRSYSSYGIPTGWNKTLLQNILLFSFMGMGKAIGGLLIDKVNIKFTTIISTILSLPFLIFGDSNMYLSLIGIMLFSMTMPITLAILISILKRMPGIAFGLTTIGLFIGSLPIFIVRIHSVMINAIIFTILTIMCFIILKRIESWKEV